MKEKLIILKEEFTRINELLSDPNILQDQKKYIELSKRRRQLEPIVQCIDELEFVDSSLSQAKELIFDKEMKELAEKEIETLTTQQEVLTGKLRIMLIPKDLHDDNNAIIEIRQAAGGDEASLFAGELARAYMKYAEILGFKTELLSWQESMGGGLKEGSFEIKGESVFSVFKYESGVHRVQRIPKTESQGRVHTSTCTVAVMPIPDNSIEIHIKESDLRIDTYRSSGAGGQHVNTTDSAIRITHLPTGIAVACQEDRSQHKNREKAMKMLTAKLYQIEEEKRKSASSELRSSQVGSGERSEKIRTYNFPQDRVTDHRIKISWSNLPGIMEGQFEDITQTLRDDEYARKLVDQKNI